MPLGLRRRPVSIRKGLGSARNIDSTPTGLCPGRRLVTLSTTKLPAMPQSLSAVYLHLIFSTKNREPWLVKPDLLAETHTFLGAVSKQLDCPPVIVGGVADHVHLLARFGRGITQSDWVKEVKRVSSHWIKEQDARMAGFAWQSGYGVFSVSPSALDDVERYIHEQAEHHRKMTFQEEFRIFLKKHRIDWDERFVWD